MDNLSSNLPQIISAAAQSHLGILALLSIALSVLAYFFFSTASEKVKVSIFALLFFGVVGFGVAMFWVPEPKQDSQGSIQTPGEKAHDDPQLPTGANRDKLSDSKMLLALSIVGVDFSVGETTLKEWLNNSSTLYPAISIELLKLLRGNDLRIRSTWMSLYITMSKLQAPLRQVERTLSISLA